MKTCSAASVMYLKTCSAAEQAAGEEAVPIRELRYATTLKYLLKMPYTVQRPKYPFSITKPVPNAAGQVVPTVLSAKPVRPAAVRGKYGAVRAFSAWRKPVRHVRVRGASSTIPVKAAAVPVCKKNAKRLRLRFPPESITASA